MLGYLLSAAVYGVILVMCVTAWRRRTAGSRLAAALGAQVGWSVVLAIDATRLVVPLILVVVADYVRDIAWGLVLVGCLRSGISSSSVDGRGAGLQLVPRSSEHKGRTPESQLTASMRWLFVALAALALVVLVVTASNGYAHPRALTRTLTDHWLWGGLAFSIGGLVLVEQVARNTRAARRWSLKHVWLAIGGLYAWDLCFYSVAMLHGSAADDFWAVRGYVDVLLAGLLAIGLSRISEWESAAFLSPRVVLFNATLLVAAAYVLVMAAGSYFVRRFGGTWGGAGQILLLASGALVLAVAVLSDQFRAWTRVTLAKHLFPYRYDYRSEWQKLTRALSQSDETPVYERIASVMGGFVSCASGGLWLRDTEGGYVPVGGKLAPPQAPRESESQQFLAYLLTNEWIYDLDEARCAAASHTKDVVRPVLPDPPDWMLGNPQIWLIIPLICESALVGFVAVGQPLATMRLGWEEIDLLRAAGRQVASFLAFEQAAKSLAEAHQFEAMNRLSAVLMHDLRHLIAQQALVVQNATRHRGNPEFFDDAILTIENSVQRMTRLMEELRSGVLTMETQRIELADLCADSIRHCGGSQPVPTLDVRDRGVEVVLNRERLQQVLEHVIRNAQEATPGDGSVTVHVRRGGDCAIIEVADTGTGMDAEFIRHRLFKPFDTTKGEQGFGIGAFEVRQFVRKCGGRIEVHSVPGKGTRFIISLPTAPVLAPVDSETAHVS